MAENKIVNADKLQGLIYTIRGVQVMYDSDLAELYGVEIKRLNEQVKRNRERFPEEFMFQLTDEDFASLWSQNATLETGRGRHRKYLPYVFTEQGVAMLSAVLRSKTAVKISIQIIKAFVAMRKFITTNAQIFHRLDAVEQKQLEHKAVTDEKFDRIFNAIESKEITPKQGVFFDGQIFDAYKFVSDLIRRAKKSIIIIDNYIDDSVLLLLTKRKKNVTVKIFTKTISKQLALDVKKYNSQYLPVEIKKFKYAHDRFIIIDDKEVFHFGASLKDLGKKWFAFSKLEKDAFRLMERLEGE
ncbi:MAG TPA: ORF6N domain-containing protein [Candidatus Bathyarchaeia archaeon]|nr:ORF6N domain-containing protein [Candidatus Bathyarchaeia archaeon]